MPAGPIGITATWGADEWARYVLDHLREESVLLRMGARLVRTNGKSVSVPRLIDDGTADWVAELAELPSDSPDGDVLKLTPKKLANVVSLSNESIDDAPVSELDQVGTALTRAVATRLDTTAFATAAATAIKPAGLLNAGYALPAQTGGVGSLDSYVRAMGTIDAAGGGALAVVINPADLTTLRLIKAATGSNEYVLQPDPEVRGASQLNGATFFPTSKIAAGTALVVQPNQIVVAVRKDITVEFSGHAKFTADATVARVIARLDWAWNDVKGAVVVGT